MALERLPNGEIIARDTYKVSIDTPASIDVKDSVDRLVRNTAAIYPLFTATHSNKLTRNFWMYTSDSMNYSVDDFGEACGAQSFVDSPKPLLMNHDIYGNPLGRIILSNYKKRSKNTLEEMPNNKLPGYVHGDGVLELVAAVTDKDTIRKILDGTLDAVSTSTRPYKLYNSLDKEDPFKFIPGQVYDGELSYLIIDCYKANELSFVNSAGNDKARIKDPNVGFEKIKLALAENTPDGAKFYDAFTGDLFDFNDKEFEYQLISSDKSFKIEDSQIIEDFWVMQGWNPVQDPSETILKDSVNNANQDIEMAQKENTTEEIKNVEDAETSVTEDTTEAETTSEVTKDEVSESSETSVEDSEEVEVVEDTEKEDVHQATQELIKQLVKEIQEDIKDALTGFLSDFKEELKTSIKVEETVEDSEVSEPVNEDSTENKEEKEILDSLEENKTENDPSSINDEAPQDRNSIKPESVNDTEKTRKLTATDFLLKRKGR